MEVKLNFVQFDIKTNDPMENIKKIENLLLKTNKKGSDSSVPNIVILPELFTTGYGNFPQIRRFSIDFQETSDLAIKQIEALKSMAKKCKITLIGSIPELESKKLFNSCIKITKDFVGVFYRKLHLIKPMDEHKFFETGKKVNPEIIDSLSIGMQICYDLRFPEAGRYLCSQGAKLLVYPANWPSVRGEHWNHLLKARAIENQCFVIGANRVGSDKWGEYFGNSQIISPLGEILLSSKQEEQSAGIQVDFDKEIQKARSKFNVHEDRKINFIL